MDRRNLLGLGGPPDRTPQFLPPEKLVVSEKQKLDGDEDTPDNRGSHGNVTPTLRILRRH